MSAWLPGRLPRLHAVPGVTIDTLYSFVCDCIDVFAGHMYDAMEQWRKEQPHVSISSELATLLGQVAYDHKIFLRDQMTKDEKNKATSVLVCSFNLALRLKFVPEALRNKVLGTLSYRFYMAAAREICKRTCNFDDQNHYHVADSRLKDVLDHSLINMLLLPEDVKFVLPLALQNGWLTPKTTCDTAWQHKRIDVLPHLPTSYVPLGDKMKLDEQEAQLMEWFVPFGDFDTDISPQRLFLAMWNRVDGIKQRQQLLSTSCFPCDRQLELLMADGSMSADALQDMKSAFPVAQLAKSVRGVYYGSLLLQTEADIAVARAPLAQDALHDLGGMWPEFGLHTHRPKDRDAAEFARMFEVRYLKLYPKRLVRK